MPMKITSQAIRQHLTLKNEAGESPVFEVTFKGYSVTTYSREFYYVYIDGVTLMLTPDKPDLFESLTSKELSLRELIKVLLEETTFGFAEQGPAVGEKLYSVWLKNPDSAFNHFSTDFLYPYIKQSERWTK